MICSPEMPTDEIPVLCKRGLGATQNKEVTEEAALRRLLFGACRGSKQANTHVAFGLAQKMHFHLKNARAASVKRYAY